MPHVEIEGLKINFDHYPPGNASRASRVAYIHGTGCNARVFRDHLQVVSRDHEIVAIDLPGHGLSEGSGFRSAVEYAFYVGQLLEHLGWSSCIVAGHSLGGGIALAVAIYFERLVAGLMLIDTGARLRVNPKIIEFARQAASTGQQIKGDARFGYAESTPHSVVDEINEINRGCRPEVLYKDWVADDSFDVMSRLAQVGVPALAICGTEDPLTPMKYHEYFRDKMPSCRLVTIERAGHWPFAENPGPFNAAVFAFLDQFRGA